LEEGEPVIKYLHTMVRISDIEESLDFYCNKLGLQEIRRIENEQAQFTLIFLATSEDESNYIELTYNWNSGNYEEGRNFGHLAYQVDNIYEICEKLMNEGVTLNRPPRDGYMAFIRSPDNISIELLQKGAPLDQCEPWASMPNIGHW
jgi:lactoylglutathione lyase